MDNWPRIPRQSTGAAQSRGGGASLPPPGSVIMASVEEDLGNGMYALRWNNNRISVSSQAILATGQSLILKSELSPEGRTTLVVQGPALPEAEANVSGGMIYSPKNRRADGGGERQWAVQEDGRESPGAPRTRQGDQPAGADVAAGVARARPPAASGPPLPSLLGLVLEPLEDFPASAGRLLESAREELAASTKNQSVIAEQEQIESAYGEHPIPENPKAAGGAEEPPRTREARPPANAPGPLEVNPAPPSAQSRPAASPEQTPVPGQDSVIPIPAESVPSAADSAEPPPAPTPARNGQKQPAAGTAEQSAPPPPTTTHAARPRPEAPPAHSLPRGQPVPDDIPDGVRGDVYVKEALTQVVRTAELPLASPSADSSSLGMGGKMPEAVADKAAGILLRAAGLTPDPETLEAAKALLSNNVQVDRQTVQALMALAAAAAAGEGEREAVMKAAARLSAKDIPLAAPLAGGLADVMERKAGVHELAARAAGLLDADPGIPQAKPLMDAAKQLLDMLHVDLDRSDAAIALERYLSTFGRETLGKALALVETAAQAVLENHSALPRIDKSLNSLLAMLENSMIRAEQAETTLGPQPPGRPEGEVAARSAESGAPPREAPESGTPAPGRTPPTPDSPVGAARQPAPVPAGSATATPQEISETLIPPAGTETEPASQPSRLHPPPGAEIDLPEAPGEAGRPPRGEAARETAVPLRLPPAEDGATTHPAPPPPIRPAAINAYMNAPRAFTIHDLRHLPPMPKVASIPQAPPTAPAHLPGAIRPVVTEGYAPAAPSDGGGPAVSPPAGTDRTPAGEPARINMPPALTRPVPAPASPLPATPPDEPLPLPATGERTAEVPTPKLPPTVSDTQTPPPSARPVPAPAFPPPATPPDEPPPSQMATGERTTEASTPKQPPVTADTQTPPSPTRHVPAPMSPPPATPPDEPPPLPATEERTAETPTPKLPPIASDTQTPSLPARPVPAPTSPPPATPPDGQPPSQVTEERTAEPAMPKPPPAAPETRTPAEPRSSVLMKLDSLFQIPGLNRPEIELLKPSGFLQRYLDSGASGGPDADKARAEAGSLIRNLLSDDPERAERALGELPRRQENVLREAASRLSRMEQEIIRSDPVLGRLSDAATSLRDLGRQLLAVKAENLAGQERDPGVMLAEVPFKLNDNGGDGRMQMFYRKSGGKRDGWTSRVILDLNTTGMGPVLGDLRFSNNDMTVNIFVEKQEAADFLAKSGANLVGALEGKGFRVKARFMVLPPPPQIQASRPAGGREGTGDTYDGGASMPKTAAMAGKKGRLDIKG